MKMEAPCYFVILLWICKIWDLCNWICDVIFDTIVMITIFCTMVLSVIQGIALNTGVLPYSKGGALQLEFAQSDLTKAQKEGLIAEGDQVVFPSSERIPKPRAAIGWCSSPSSCAAYPFLPINFSMCFSLFTVCSFTSSCQTRFYTSLALSLFASLSWGSSLIGFSRNFCFASALASLCWRSLS
jgi:hypothetical protein